MMDIEAKNIILYRYRTKAHIIVSYVENDPQNQKLIEIVKIFENSHLNDAAILQVHWDDLVSEFCPPLNIDKYTVFHMQYGHTIGTIQNPDLPILHKFFNICSEIGLKIKTKNNNNIFKSPLTKDEIFKYNIKLKTPGCLVYQFIQELKPQGAKKQKSQQNSNLTDREGKKCKKKRRTTIRKPIINRPFLNRGENLPILPLNRKIINPPTILLYNNSCSEMGFLLGGQTKTELKTPNSRKNIKLIEENKMNNTKIKNLKPIAPKPEPHLNFEFKINENNQIINYFINSQISSKTAEKQEIQETIFAPKLGENLIKSYSEPKTENILNKPIYNTSSTQIHFPQTIENKKRIYVNSSPNTTQSSKFNELLKSNQNKTLQLSLINNKNSPIQEIKSQNLKGVLLKPENTLNFTQPETKTNFNNNSEIKGIGTNRKFNENKSYADLKNYTPHNGKVDMYSHKLPSIELSCLTPSEHLNLTCDTLLNSTHPYPNPNGQSSNSNQKQSEFLSSELLSINESDNSYHGFYNDEVYHDATSLFYDSDLAYFN